MQPSPFASRAPSPSTDPFSAAASTPPTAGREGLTRTSTRDPRDQAALRRARAAVESGDMVLMLGHLIAEGSFVAERVNVAAHFAELGCGHPASASASGADVQRKLANVLAEQQRERVARDQLIDKYRREEGMHIQQAVQAADKALAAANTAAAAAAAAQAALEANALSTTQVAADVAGAVTAELAGTLASQAAQAAQAEASRRPPPVASRRAPPATSSRPPGPRPPTAAPARPPVVSRPQTATPRQQSATPRPQTAASRMHVASKR